MSNTFLQEIDATIILWDVTKFSRLAADMGALELASALERFYEHVERYVQRHGGRIVKFVGDAVLSVVLGSGDVDHAGQALLAITEAARERQSWLDSCLAAGAPAMDFKVVATTGSVLAGYLGTPTVKFWDVLGEPVITAFRLAGVAAERDQFHLFSAELLDACRLRPAAKELEAIQVGGRPVRIFHLEQL